MQHSDVSIWRFKTLKASSLSFAALALHFVLHLKTPLAALELRQMLGGDYIFM